MFTGCTDIQKRLYDFDLCLRKILISTVGFDCSGLYTCCTADIHKRLCNQDCSQDLKNLQVKQVMKTQRALNFGLPTSF
jgi:hypothetical protein